MGTGQLLGLGLGAVGTGINAIGQRRREKRSMRNQEKLMGIQHGYQRNLNEHGHELGKKMFDHTFMPIEQIKAKGMNPALLYGMGGAGGTTAGSPSGGSAASGSAPQPQPMELGSAMAAATTQANIELAKSQAEKNRAEASSIRGEEGTIGASQIGKTKEETITETQRGGLVMQQAIKEAEEVSKLSRENRIGNATEEKIIRGIGLDVIGKELANQLEKAKINLSEQQRKELEHRIYQNWVKLGTGSISSLGGMIKEALKGKK